MGDSWTPKLNWQSSGPVTRKMQVLIPHKLTFLVDFGSVGVGIMKYSPETCMLF